MKGILKLSIDVMREYLCWGKSLKGEECKKIKVLWNGNGEGEGEFSLFSTS